jgi:D-3-phosphoglycerate dehydrogenase
MINSANGKAGDYMIKKVFISTTSFAKDDPTPLKLLKNAGLDVSINPFARKLTEKEISGFLLDIDYLIAGTEPLTKLVLESAKKLKSISRVGAGLDNVDLDAAKHLGIKVFNTPHGPTQAVAELTVGLILDILRMSGSMDRDIRKGIWKKRMGSLLKGKKVGIIGFGRIGQKVAELLTPFGAEIAHYDINVVKTVMKCTYKPINELLQWADIITLHCPASEENKPLIGKEEFKNMKKGAWLINTSRGGLVDERSLYTSLKEGYLSGAALDVFEKEPYDGPLSELDNVILTPHIGSYAKEARIEMEADAVENLLAGLNFDQRDRII